MNEGYLFEDSRLRILNFHEGAKDGVFGQVKDWQRLLQELLKDPQ